MFIPYPVLVQAAIEAGINPALVEDRCILDDYTDAARLCFGDTTVLVMQSVSDVNCIYAKLKPVGAKKFFVTKQLKADDYPILTGIIEAVTTEKLYSCPWVAHDVVDRLEKENIKSSFTIENASTAVITLDDDPALKVRIVSDGPNMPRHYWYRLVDSKGNAVLKVQGEASLDKLVDSIYSAISEVYKEHQNTTKPESNPDCLLKFGEDADVKNVLFYIYQKLEQYVVKHNLQERFSLSRTSSKEFSVADKLSDKEFTVAIDPFTEGITLYSRALSESNGLYTAVLTTKKTDPYRIFALTSEILGSEG